MGDLSEVVSLIETHGTEIKNWQKQVEGEISNVKTDSAGADKALKELRTEFDKACERWNAIAQAGHRKSDAPEIIRPETLGSKFVAQVGAETLKRVANKDQNTAAATVLKTITTGMGTANNLVAPYRLPGIVAPATWPLRVRDLIPTAQTDSNVVEFVRENVFTNAAAPVAEAAQKPESNITFQKAAQNIRTIAHWVLVTRQALMDVAQLEAYINNRLEYGIEAKVEDQLLNGDGTGENLLGFLPQATAMPAVTGTPNLVDQLINGIAAAYIASNYRPDGIVMNPGDASKLALLKDSTGAYLFGNPLMNPGMFTGFGGIQIAWSKFMAAGTYLIGAFRENSQIFEREGITVMASSEDRDNFIKNLVTILAETRLTLVVYQPTAFVKGTFA